MTPLTIEDLKKHLGPGLGLRQAKYMLEIPVPGQKGETLNVLCRSTAFPERNIGTVPVYDKGRKYNIRAESDFPGTYNISILDDSSMALRWLFDGWLNLVDDTLPQGDFVQSSSSYEARPSFSLGQFGEGGQSKYQADVNIWQLGNMGEKVYGYKLQNAFPSTVGIVELDDSNETSLSEFSVTFTYSESIPLKPTQISVKPSAAEKGLVKDPTKNGLLSTPSTVNPYGSSRDITSEDLENMATGTGGFVNADTGTELNNLSSVSNITSSLPSIPGSLGNTGNIGSQLGNIGNIGSQIGNIRNIPNQFGSVINSNIPQISGINEINNFTNQLRNSVNFPSLPNLAPQSSLNTNVSVDLRNPTNISVDLPFDV